MTNNGLKRLSYSVGKVPLSLLRVFSVLIATASSISLVVVSRGFDNTLMLDQSTGLLLGSELQHPTTLLEEICR